MHVQEARRWGLDAMAKIGLWEKNYVQNGCSRLKEGSGARDGIHVA